MLWVRRIVAFGLSAFLMIIRTVWSSTNYAFDVGISAANQDAIIIVKATRTVEETLAAAWAWEKHLAGK